MRFMSVIKVRRSLQVVQKKIFGTNYNAEQCGCHIKHSEHRSPVHPGSIHAASVPKGLVSNVGEDVFDAGMRRGVLQTTRQFMAPVSASRGWRSLSRDTRIIWETGEGRMGIWSRLLSLLQPKVFRMLGPRMQITKTLQAACPRRPAIFVTIVDNKGQVIMRSLGLILGGAYILAVRPVAVAEQLDGLRALNSLNRRRLSVYGKSAALLYVTVESVSLVLRAIYLLGLFMPCFILAPIADAVGGQWRTHWLELLLATLERAGPAFIKWGQWAATRPDIFSQDICDLLSKLHMQAPSHSFQQTRQICETAFKVQLEDIFEEFSRDPVASGSIAQVHRAVLKGQGSTSSKPKYVAVKVRHPGVSNIIQQDFVIMKWIANVSRVLPGLQHLQLDKSVQQFASFMTKQVDLTLEAAHLLRFIYNFRKVSNVSFPVPIYPWVHPAVLVETYEEGQSIANFVDFTTVLTRTHAQLAHIGSSALLKMLLKDNFVHGDLHPGNIFVRFTGSRPNVVLLDVGMTAELNQRSRDILLELFKAVARKDGRSVAKWTLQFSEDQSCPDPEGFSRDVDAKFKEYLMKRGTAQNTGECMTELFDQVRKHRVNIEGDVCTVMVTTLILEGWQRKLDPDLDIISMVGDLLFKREWAIPYEYALSAIAAP